MWKQRLKGQRNTIKRQTRLWFNKNEALGTAFEAQLTGLFILYVW